MNDEKPLSKETIVDAKLHILNPAEIERYSISLWVEHEGGIEFPVINSAGLTLFTSASTEFAGCDPVELSDEFYKELAGMFPKEQFINMMFPVTEITVSNRKMPQTERWVIKMIQSMMNENKVPFEIEWLIEEAHRRMA